MSPSGAKIGGTTSIRHHVTGLSSDFLNVNQCQTSERSTISSYASVSTSLGSHRPRGQQRPQPSAKIPFPSLSTSSSSTLEELWGICAKDFILFEHSGLLFGKVIKVIEPALDDECNFSHLLVGVLEAADPPSPFSSSSSCCHAPMLGQDDHPPTPAELPALVSDVAFRFTGEHCALSFPECIYGVVAPLAYDYRQNCYRPIVPIEISVHSRSIVRHPITGRETESRALKNYVVASACPPLPSPPIRIQPLCIKRDRNDLARSYNRNCTSDLRSLSISSSSGSLNSSLGDEGEDDDKAAKAEGTEGDGVINDGDCAVADTGDDEGELAAWDMPLMAGKNRRVCVASSSLAFSMRPSPRKAPVEEPGDGPTDEVKAWSRAPISPYEGVEPDPTRNYRATIKIYKSRVSSTASSSTPSVQQQRAPGLYASALEAAFARDVHTARLIMKQQSRQSDASVRLFADFNFRI